MLGRIPRIVWLGLGVVLLVILLVWVIPATCGDDESQSPAAPAGKGDESAQQPGTESAVRTVDPDVWSAEAIVAAESEPPEEDEGEPIPVEPAEDREWGFGKLISKVGKGGASQAQVESLDLAEPVPTKPAPQDPALIEGIKPRLLAMVEAPVTENLAKCKGKGKDADSVRRAREYLKDAGEFLCGRKWDTTKASSAIRKADQQLKTTSEKTRKRCQPVREQVTGKLQARLLRLAVESDEKAFNATEKGQKEILCEKARRRWLDAEAIGPSPLPVSDILKTCAIKAAPPDAGASEEPQSDDGGKKSEYVPEKPEAIPAAE